MSQKPANPREPVAEGALARDANATENAQEPREKTGSAATSKRLSPAPGKGQTQSNVVRSNAVPAHARPPQHQVARATATAGPIRAVAANDDMPSIGGLIYALQQRPSKMPFYVAMVASGVWFVLGMVITWAMVTNNADASASFFDLLSAREMASFMAAT